MTQIAASCQLLELQYLLGKKWTLPILVDFREGNKSFNEIKKSAKNIVNSTLLSKMLKELVNYNILKKVENGKLRYELTEEGKEFVDILVQLKEWAGKNGFAVNSNCKDHSCLECGYFIDSKCNY